MKIYSMDDVFMLIRELPKLIGTLDRRNKIFLLHLIAENYEHTEVESVSVYAREFLWYWEAPMVAGYCWPAKDSI